MDPTSIIQTISAKGTLFWVASGSVALGVTLILAAAVGQIRLLRSRRSGPGEVTSETSVPPAASVSVPPEDEISNHFEAAIDPVDVHEMLLLLRRVRSLSDKLEDFQRKTSSRPADATESPLKVAPGAVDYVFRAGIG